MHSDISKSIIDLKGYEIEILIEVVHLKLYPQQFKPENFKD